MYFFKGMSVVVYLGNIWIYEQEQIVVVFMVGLLNLWWVVLKENFGLNLCNYQVSIVKEYLIGFMGSFVFE